MTTIRTYTAAPLAMPAADREAYIREATAQGCPIRYSPKTFRHSLVVHPDGTGVLVFVTFDPWIRTDAHAYGPLADAINHNRGRFHLTVRTRPVPHARRLAVFMEETTDD